MDVLKIAAMTGIGSFSFAEPARTAHGKPQFNKSKFFEPLFQSFCLPPTLTQVLSQSTRITSNRASVSFDSGSVIKKIPGVIRSGQI